MLMYLLSKQQNKYASMLGRFENTISFVAFSFSAVIQTIPKLRAFQKLPSVRDRRWRPVSRAS